LDIGGDDLIVGGEPARHALLHELLVGLDRELDAGISRAFGLVVVPRTGRADAEALPRIAQRQGQRVALEGVGPTGAAALHGVGDKGAPALAEKKRRAASGPTRRGLEGPAGEPPPATSAKAACPCGFAAGSTARTSARLDICRSGPSSRVRRRV